MFLSLSIPLFILIVWLLNSIKIVAAGERAVIFRVGRLVPGPKGPGLVWAFPPFDRMVRVNVLQQSFETVPTEIRTEDGATVQVKATVSMRVVDAERAVTQVADYVRETARSVQEALQSTVSRAGFDELRERKGRLADKMRGTLQHQTATWGVQVESVSLEVEPARRF